ncbi:hypothetical protein GGR58DRAFT_319035 [Xylaria digitata]|nr:hypothetical protein GGR58DRAFT_319035 [Xylaria digitata]
MSRRQESYLRLETLGHLSDHYSDVASVSGRPSSRSSDDESQWELDSNSSKESTLAVVFDKRPPPGLRASNGTTSRSISGRSNVSDLDEYSINSSLAKKPYVAHDDTSQSQTFNVSQLRPAKDLRQTRHPLALTPGAWVQRAGSEYCMSDSSKALEFSGAISPNEQYKVRSGYSGERHPATIPAAPSMVTNDPAQVNQPRTMSDRGDKQTSQRVSYSSYRSPTPSYSQTAFRPTSTYSAYCPREAEPSQELRDHTVRTPISLCESPSTYYGVDTSEDDDARSNYSNATSQPPQPANHPSSTYVNGPLPSQFPPRRPSTRAMTHVDGVDFEMVSTAIDHTPVSMHTPIPIPAPAPTNFVSLAHGRGRQISTSSIYSRSSRSPSPAYGAYRDPDLLCQKPPSFLQRVQARLERSVHEKLVTAGWRSLPSFDVIKVEKSPTGYKQMWPEEGQKGAAGGEKETQPRAPRAETRKERKEDWEISSSSEAEIESEAELFHAKQGLLKTSRLAPQGSPSNLRVDTSLTNSSVPVGVVELKTLMEPPAGGQKDEEEYSPMRVAKDMECTTCQPQRWSQTQLPRAQSSMSLYQDQDEGSDLKRTRSSATLTREQVQFASLPSPLEDLWQPFPYDNRRNLPSQAEQQDVARRHTLTRKKGMQLR